MAFKLHSFDNTFLDSWKSCRFYRSLTLSHGAMAWSDVCVCGIY